MAKEAKGLIVLFAFVLFFGGTTTLHGMIEGLKKYLQLVCLFLQIQLNKKLKII